MKPRVLVVDDELGVRKALQRGLRAEGMDVATAADGPTALRMARTGAFDALLLDIMLPGLSGYRVLQQLRADGTAVPVLLISAKDGEIDQADGLDLGADGYVVKPFSFTVLVAQVRAVLRRAESGNARRSLRIGQLRLDRGKRQVWWGEIQVELTPREFALLNVLVSRAGTVVTKAELLDEVWAEAETVTKNVVEVYVGYVRRKLDAVGAGDVLRTVRGHGYLAADPETEATHAEHGAR